MRAAFRPVAAGPDLLYSDGGTAAPRSTSEKNTKRTRFLTTNAESMGYDLFSSRAGPPAQRDLTDRSGGIRGDFDRSPVAQASKAMVPRPADVALFCWEGPQPASTTTADRGQNTKQTQFLTTNAESMGYDGFSSTAGPPAQRDLTDRSGGIRGDFDLSPVAHGSAVVLPRLAAVGYNGNAARTLSVGPGRDKQSCLSSRRQAVR